MGYLTEVFMNLGSPPGMKSAFVDYQRLMAHFHGSTPIARMDPRPSSGELGRGRQLINNRKKYDGEAIFFRLVAP
jgi:hypothetical protein